MTKSTIENVYSILLKKFGTQGWWPVTPENEVMPKYFQKLSSSHQRFEIIIGAILTQNTSWKNVEKAIIKLNEHILINVDKMIRIKKEKLAEIIYSSGYHNQKSLKLKNFCHFLYNRYHGNLCKFLVNPVKKLREELLSINGIGPETADSIILYAAEKPIFVIDAYTKRIFQRIGFKETKYEELQKLFMENLEKDVNIFKEYHALIVELGKNICLKKPICRICPLKQDCNYFNYIFKSKNKTIKYQINSRISD